MTGSRIWLNNAYARLRSALRGAGRDIEGRTGRRLIIVVNDLQPYGAQRVAVSTVEMLSSQWEIVLCTLEPPGIGELVLPPYVERISLQRTRRGPFGYVQLVVAMRRVLCTEPRPTVLSHMMFSNLVVLLARKLGGRTSCKCAVVDHSPPGLSLSLERSGLLMRWLGRLLYGSASRVVGVSDAVSRDVEATFRLPAGAVQTIYNSIDIEAVRQSVAALPPHPWLEHRSGKVIVCVAGFRPVKQHELLLSALAHLDDVRLIMVGDGPRLGAMKSLANSLGVAPRCAFVGFSTNSSSYIAAADVLVIPSKWEGFGLVAVEAAAVGVPVVAFAVGALPELVPDVVPGSLLEDRTPHGLANGIRRELGNAHVARGHRLEVFSRSRISGQYRSLIEQIDDR